MAVVQNVLRPIEAEVVDKLYKLFSAGISEMDDIWGEKPCLHRGRVLFEQRRNRIIPVVELYFVLGGQYRHGSYYKASIVTEFPEHYSYDHKCIPYRLTPSSWRKTAEKRLIEVLRKLISERSDEIPPRVSKLLVKEGPRSLHVFCRFLGHKVPSLALVLTPALEGSGLPEGFGGTASEARAAHLTKNSSPVWLLVPPVDVTNASQGWELVFPNVTEGILKPEDWRPLQAALFLSWLAEKRGWSKSGLHNSSSAFQTLALNLASNQDNFTTRNFREQLKALTTALLQSIKTGSLTDFCLPAMNYLSGITESQQENLSQEAEDLLKTIENTESLWEMCRDYPLLMPDSVPRDLESRGGDSCDDGDSERSSSSDCLLHGVQMDEGGGGEGAFELESPPPLDAKDLQIIEGFNQDKKVNRVSKFGNSCLAERLSQTGWGAYVDGQVIGCLLMVILMATAIIFILPSIVGQFEHLSSYFGQDDATEVPEPDVAEENLPETDEAPEPSDPLLGPDDKEP